MANEPALSLWQAGLWQWRMGQARQVLAGVTDRSANVETIQARLPDRTTIVQAQQVHGASLAAIEAPVAPEPQARAAEARLESVSGCDALSTQARGLALIIRSADCLPIFVWDPLQRVIALAHAGWRGVAAGLPARLIRFLHTRYHSRSDDLWVGIGPAIRACCFEVGEEFEGLFAGFIRRADGRRTCDLIGCATQQLLTAGIRPTRLRDSGLCTACDPARWHSYRRDGEMGGRLVSFIAIRP